MYFYVYILKCSDSTYYTGQTDNLEQRLSQHNNSTFDCYTSIRLPVKLVFQEVFTSRIEALEAERKIKTWGKRKKEILINFGWQGFTSAKKVK